MYHIKQVTGTDSQLICSYHYFAVRYYTQDGKDSEQISETESPSKESPPNSITQVYAHTNKST